MNFNTTLLKPGIRNDISGHGFIFTKKSLEKIVEDFKESNDKTPVFKDDRMVGQVENFSIVDDNLVVSGIIDENLKLDKPRFSCSGVFVVDNSTDEINHLNTKINSLKIL